MGTVESGSQITIRELVSRDLISTSPSSSGLAGINMRAEESLVEEKCLVVDSSCDKVKARLLKNGWRSDCECPRKHQSQCCPVAVMTKCAEDKKATITVSSTALLLATWGHGSCTAIRPARTV